MVSHLSRAVAGASAFSLLSVSNALAFEDFHAAMKWAGDQEHAATVVALSVGSIVVGLMLLMARQPRAFPLSPESLKSSMSLFWRNSRRETGSHFRWNCSKHKSAAVRAYDAEIARYRASVQNPSHRR